MRATWISVVGCSLVLGFVAVAGCGGTQSQSNDQPPVATSESDPAEQDVKDEESPSPVAGGRMAFTECDPAQRPEICTKEYRPVCGVVDTGVRCITTPCDSTEQRNFGNACMACAHDKTNGYWPVACESLGNDAQ